MIDRPVVLKAERVLRQAARGVGKPAG